MADRAHSRVLYDSSLSGPANKHQATGGSAGGDGVALRTRLTKLLDLEYPIVLAPMSGLAGGHLAAAVSNAGGLGLVGGGYGDAAWLRAQLDIVRSGTERPWGVGFITWYAEPDVVDLALSYRPDVVFLSFGDPRRYATQVKAAGALLMCQVQEVEAARDAVEAGADFVVAQGTEAGGHGAQRATFPLVPAVVDAVNPVPVLAAGGIADGRGLAAAMMLGAEGAVAGTRFLVSRESLLPDAAKTLLCGAGAGDTVRTRVLDMARNYSWPEEFTGRALRNPFLERWHGHELELEEMLEDERARYARAVAEGDFETAGVFVGEGIDLVRDVVGAGELVRRMGGEAEGRFRRGATMVE
jgi:nitronate monooxygenase